MIQIEFYFFSIWLFVVRNYLFSRQFSIVINSYHSVAFYFRVFQHNRSALWLEIILNPIKQFFWYVKRLCCNILQTNIYYTSI